MNENAVMKLNNQIEVDKEILSVLPINNKKNLKEYKLKCEEIKKNYENYLENINSEIKRKAVRINSILPNPKISELQQQIKYMEKIKLLDVNITSFEKMDLDQILFVLKRFYKNNLELINENIIKCIDKFKLVGIDLKNEDFNYSIYTKEYMKVLLQEMKNGDINSTRVKENFEQIYWKCSDIITHIELNIRSLYLKYEKQIDKYFEDARKDILKEFEVKEKEEAYKKFNSLKAILLKQKDKDSNYILQMFTDKRENPKDYEKIAVQGQYKKLLGIDYEDLEKDQIDEFNKNIFRLRDNLFEYKNFLRYKFIYDDIMEIYNTKEKYATIYNQKLKQIKKLETVLFKINKKQEKQAKHSGLILKIFNKINKNNNKLEKRNNDVNSIILELKENYRELEKNKVRNIISNVLTDHSTIYDALSLIKPFCSFLVDSVIKKYEDISQEDIETTIGDFWEFIEFPNITIINNATITEDKDLSLVIKDKYNLCNIKFNKEDLDEENLDKLINTTKIICNSYSLENSQITLEDIKFVLQVSKMFGEEE